MEWLLPLFLNINVHYVLIIYSINYMGKGEIITTLIFFNIILITFIIGIVVFVRQYRLKKKQHLSEIENIDELHQQEILETQVEIQIQTMKHIGREIHDNIGQKLTLASLYAQQILLEQNGQQTNEKVSEIGNIIDNSLQELRQLSKSLTSDAIKQLSLVELIKAECEKLNKLKECKIHFKDNSKNKTLGYQTKSILFRIIQEFFQNSIKHAKCQNVWVTLSKNKEGIELVLEDDGKGFNTDILNKNGIGLKNMKKRTQLIGGDFNLISQRGKGTSLTIKIPVR